MTRLILILLSALAISADTPIYQKQPAGIVIRIQSGKIHIGDSTLLTWNAAGADSIYISHLGHVPSSGSVKISPRRTTTYTVFAEIQGKSQSATAKVIVLGARGDDDFPRRNDRFRYPLTAKCRSASFARFLDRIVAVLQDEYSLGVDEYSTPRTAQYIIITTRKERPDLLDSREPTIKARRVAYRITITIPPGASREYSYTVETLIERRKRIVPAWKPDDKPEISLQEAKKLRDRINAGA